ncbi:alpha/beta-hydrolase [Trametes meyenii]|nr:alpha/beta-hydrolase [Trametes meyenii]
MAFRTTTVNPLYPSRQTADGLRLVAKCYVPEVSSAHGATLLLFHCAGSHKETWEPALEHLFAARGPADGRGAPLVREAWAFEMQSHGEAALANDAALRAMESPLTVEEYADAVKRFVASGALAGHRLVGVGHSLGATALLLTTTSDALPGIAYDALVLVEPSLITREAFDANLAEREGALRAMSEAVSRRRDAWASREDAAAYFKKRFPWSIWHPRVLDLYVKYGLRDAPAIPDTPPGEEKKKGVTLCCTKAQERATYLHVAPHFVVIDTIRGLPPALPLHFVLGERVDLIPEYIHQSVIDVRKVASVQKVPDGGHFVVQENPEGLASAVTSILAGAAAAAAAPKASL